MQNSLRKACRGMTLLLASALTSISCDCISDMRRTPLFSDDVEYVQIPCTKNGTTSLTVDWTDVRIYPSIEGVKARERGGRTRVTLPAGTGYWMIEGGGGERLFVLGEPDLHKEARPGGEVLVTEYIPDEALAAGGMLTEYLQRAIDESAASDALLVFPRGVYPTASLTMGSGAHVWLERGAVISGSADVADYPVDEGFIESDKVNRPESYTDNGERMTFSRLILIEGKDISLRGYGEIDGNGTQLRAQGKPANLIRVRSSEDVLIEGLFLKDPAAWNTHILNSRRVIIRSVKVMNNPLVPNTDGFDPDSSSEILIEDCFAYCSDDNVAVKSTNNSGLLQNCTDICVKGCTFVTRKSALKIGTETKAERMSDIRFVNNTVIECDRAFVIYCNDGTHVCDVLFENNRVERNYPDSQRKLIHFKISRRDGEGLIDGVVIKDCICVEPFPRTSEIRGLDKDHPVSGVTLDNLTISGVKQSDVMDFVNLKYTDNIIIK